MAANKSAAEPDVFQPIPLYADDVDALLQRHRTCLVNAATLYLYHQYCTIIYATADEAVAYMFYRCFFAYFCFFVFFRPQKYETTVLENG